MIFLFFIWILIIQYWHFEELVLDELITSPDFKNEKKNSFKIDLRRFHPGEIKKNVIHCYVIIELLGEVWFNNSLISLQQYIYMIYRFRGKEPQVLDYQTQQYKLLPLLATTYAFKFAAMGMSSIYSKISGEIDRGNLEALPQVLWNHFYSWGTNFRGFRG